MNFSSFFWKTTSIKKHLCLLIEIREVFSENLSEFYLSSLLNRKVCVEWRLTSQNMCIFLFSLLLWNRDDFFHIFPHHYQEIDLLVPMYHNTKALGITSIIGDQVSLTKITINFNFSRLKFIVNIMYIVKFWNIKKLINYA